MILDAAIMIAAVLGLGFGMAALGAYLGERDFKRDVNRQFGITFAKGAAE